MLPCSRRGQGFATSAGQLQFSVRVKAPVTFKYDAAAAVLRVSLRSVVDRVKPVASR